jgi:preprotein translocase subunit YajC
MQTGSFDLMGFMPIVVIFVIFYFLILRPQQKKAKEHQQTLNALRRGDRVVTNGGVMGVITKVVNDQEVQLEIADNVRVRLLRAAISEVLSKTEPVASSSEPVEVEKKTAEPKSAEPKAAPKKAAAKASTQKSKAPTKAAPKKK